MFEVLKIIVQWFYNHHCAPITNYYLSPTLKTVTNESFNHYSFRPLTSWTCQTIGCLRVTWSNTLRKILLCFGHSCTMMENKQSTVLQDNNVAFWDNKIWWKWNAITVLDSVPMEKRKDKILKNWWKLNLEILFISTWLAMR